MSVHDREADEDIFFFFHIMIKFQLHRGGTFKVYVVKIKKKKVSTAYNRRKDDKLSTIISISSRNNETHLMIRSSLFVGTSLSFRMFEPSSP